MARDLGRNHYSKETLSAAEKIQETIGNSKLGKRLISVTNGSRYPGYLQLNWFSRGISADLRDSVTIDGDQKAGIIPRRWTNAVILGLSQEEIEGLKDEHSEGQEAVAYMSEGVAHVGVSDSGENIFTETDEQGLEIAMRRGKGSLEATAGLWIPPERHFVSAGSIAVERFVGIDGLSQANPGIKLV